MEPQGISRGHANGTGRHQHRPVTNVASTRSARAGGPSRCGPGETFASWRTRCAMNNLDDAGARRCASEFLRKPHGERWASSLIQMAGIAGVEQVNVLLHHRFRSSVIVIGRRPTSQARPPLAVARAMPAKAVAARALICSFESAPCPLEVTAGCVRYLAVVLSSLANPTLRAKSGSVLGHGSPFTKKRWPARCARGP
jgi:hypothetical protein